MADEETNAVRVQASLYLFGNYEFTPAPQAAQITDRALTLNINCLGNRACSLVLSFKHIMRVDLLDNQESRGVGLWVYMNHYMADRIQRKFQLDPNTFLHLRLPFGLEYRSVCLVEFTSAFSFLVFDVQNAAPEIVDALRIVLRRAGEFRNDYLRRRFALKGQPSPPAPNMLGIVSYEEWRRRLAPLHKDFEVLEVVLKNEHDEQVVFYTGRLVNIMPKFDRKRFQNRLPQLGPAPKVQRLRRLAPEVHTLDDEQEEGGGASPQHTRSLVAVFKPTPRVECHIHGQDVETLNNDNFLNDTIIEFYLNYVLHKLASAPIRNKVHLFNCFFFSKLSKNVPLQMNKLPKQRPKRLQENYNQLKSWTKGVNVFEKNFLVVPINEDAHWYFAVVLNPRDGIVLKDDFGSGAASSSQSTSARTRTEFPTVTVFIFDSLIDPQDAKRHQNVVDFLSHYLAMEYKEKKDELRLPGCGYRQHVFKLMLPVNTPQQRNHYDCGIYMLQFAEVFLCNPPKLGTFTPESTFEELFGKFSVRNKREEIKRIIRHMAEDMAAEKAAAAPSSSSAAAAAAALEAPKPDLDLKEEKEEQEDDDEEMPLISPEKPGPARIAPTRSSYRRAPSDPAVEESLEEDEEELEQMDTGKPLQQSSPPKQQRPKRKSATSSAATAAGAAAEPTEDNFIPADPTVARLVHTSTPSKMVSSTQ